MVMIRLVAGRFRTMPKPSPSPAAVSELRRAGRGGGRRLSSSIGAFAPNAMQIDDKPPGRIHGGTMSSSRRSPRAANDRPFSSSANKLSDFDVPAAAPTKATETKEDETDEEGRKRKLGRRVWPAVQRGEGTSRHGDGGDNRVEDSSAVGFYHWDSAVDEADDPRAVEDSLERICAQERVGGRMMGSQLGVLREDPHEDMRLMVENFTAAALASALRDREDVLQHCATLLANNELDEVTKLLRPYQHKYIQRRRHGKDRTLDLRRGFDARSIEMIRRRLNRMPRTVSSAHSKRAGVVLPLCNVDGVPCILFEKRSARLRAHPDEVCLPGGMVSEEDDRSVVETCKREMEEEIGLGRHRANVLGVLRCNWGEVHHLVGVAVTPVVCYLGEIGDCRLHPNPDEVSECFTVPLEAFLDQGSWVHKKNYAPFFTGGPHIIWGLTGYMVYHLVRDIIEPYDVVFD